MHSEEFLCSDVQTKSKRKCSYLSKQHCQHHFIALRRKTLGKQNMRWLLLRCRRRSSGRLWCRRRTGVGLNVGSISGGSGRFFPLSPLGTGNICPVALGDPIRLVLGIGQLEILSEKGETLFLLEGDRRRLDVLENDKCLTPEAVFSERNDFQDL